MKKTNRPFRIGNKGNGLMWFIGGLGFCGSLLAFILSFIPPSQIAGLEVGVFGVVSSQWNGSNWLSLFVQLGLRDE